MIFFQSEVDLQYKAAAGKKQDKKLQDTTVAMSSIYCLNSL